MRNHEWSAVPFRTNPIASTATSWKPIEPAMTYAKNLANAFVAGFRRISFAFLANPKIRRHDKNHKQIIFAALGRLFRYLNSKIWANHRRFRDLEFKWD